MTAWNTAKLADDEDFGEMEDTYVIYVTRRVDWCYRQDLELIGGGSSPMKVARRSSDARRRRRRAPNVPSEPGTSFMGSPRS